MIEKPSTGRVVGTIAAILSSKQYGFIAFPKQKYTVQGGKVIDINEDLFFHHTAVKDDGGFSCFQPGMLVSFLIIEGERGPKAVGVERAE